MSREAALGMTIGIVICAVVAIGSLLYLMGRRSRVALPGMICDLCASPENVAVVPLAAVKDAARQGFRPRSIYASARAIGMPTKHAEEAWVRQLDNDTSDWAVCGSCAILLARLVVAGDQDYAPASDTLESQANRGKFGLEIQPTMTMVEVEKVLGLPSFKDSANGLIALLNELLPEDVRQDGEYDLGTGIVWSFKGLPDDGSDTFVIFDSGKATACQIVDRSTGKKDVVF